MLFTKENHFQSKGVRRLHFFGKCLCVSVKIMIYCSKFQHVTALVLWLPEECLWSLIDILLCTNTGLQLPQ